MFIHSEHSDIQHPDSEILPAPVKYPCSAFAKVDHHPDFSLHRQVLPVLTLHIDGIMYGWLVCLDSFIQHCLWNWAVLLIHSLCFPVFCSGNISFTFIYCARVFRYLFCHFTLWMFWHMSFGGRMRVWWIHTSVSASFGSKGIHVKL